MLSLPDESLYLLLNLVLHPAYYLTFHKQYIKATLVNTVAMMMLERYLQFLTHYQLYQNSIEAIKTCTA